MSHNGHVSLEMYAGHWQASGGAQYALLISIFPAWWWRYILKAISIMRPSVVMVGASAAVHIEFKSWIKPDIGILRLHGHHAIFILSCRRLPAHYAYFTLPLYPPLIISVWSYIWCMQRHHTASITIYRAERLIATHQLCAIRPSITIELIAGNAKSEMLPLPPFPAAKPVPHGNENESIWLLRYLILISSWYSTPREWSMLIFPSGRASAVLLKRVSRLHYSRRYTQGNIDR